MAASASAPANNTALRRAIYAGDHETVLSLLDGGADPNLVEHDAAGVRLLTPLMMACLAQPEEMGRTLLVAGADPDAQNHLGERARDMWIKFQAICDEYSEWKQRQAEARPAMAALHRERMPWLVSDRVAFYLGAKQGHPSHGGRNKATFSDRC